MRSGGPRLCSRGRDQTNEAFEYQCSYKYSMTSKLPLTATLESAVGMAPIVSLHHDVIVIQCRYDGLQVATGDWRRRPEHRAVDIYENNLGLRPRTGLA